ncbi:hypothetical protein GLOTRDRAFT_117133, partial [Gloeophyllum trabeum ATCC 11539]
QAQQKHFLLSTTASYTLVLPSARSTSASPCSSYHGHEISASIPHHEPAGEPGGHGPLRDLPHGLSEPVRTRRALLAPTPSQQTLAARLSAGLPPLAGSRGVRGARKPGLGVVGGVLRRRGGRRRGAAEARGGRWDGE